MSRLAKMAIPVPKGVEVKAESTGQVHFKGPKGSLALTFPEGLSLKIEGDLAYVEKEEKAAVSDAMHGLYRSLAKNAFEGVATGYQVRLTMIGVGYRAAVQGNKLDLQVGNSHPTFVEIPKELKVSVDKGTVIVVEGINKALVGQFAATVRAEKPPEPYKGKGIRYENEYVRKKEGKAAKGKA